MKFIRNSDPRVTLIQLWQEYKTHHPEGDQYSWFSDQYREWRGTLNGSMRQTHEAGDKLFIDYAGQTVAVVNQQTGDIRQTQIFVATLGASSYSYAKRPGASHYSTGLAPMFGPLNYMGMTRGASW